MKLKSASSFSIYIMASLSLLFVQLKGIYICLGEPILFLIILRNPYIWKYSRNKLTLPIIIFLLASALITSELYSNSNPFTGQVYFLRFIFFIFAFYATCIKLNEWKSNNLVNNFSFLLSLLAFSGLISCFVLRDGYINSIIAAEKLLTFNALWKLSYSLPVTLFSFTYLFKLLNRPNFYFTLSISVGLINLYLDNRFVGILFIFTALLSILLNSKRTSPIYSLSIIAIVGIFSYAFYTNLSSNNLLSLDAITRAEIIDSSIKSETTLLSIINRGSINTTISAITSQPFLGLSSYAVEDGSYSLHSVFFSYWALWGLTFPAILSAIIIIPIVINLFDILSSSAKPTLKASLVAISVFLIWNLFFSPLASYRLMWAMLTGLVLKFPISKWPTQLSTSRWL